MSKSLFHNILDYVKELDEFKEKVENRKCKVIECLVMFTLSQREKSETEVIDTITKVMDAMLSSDDNAIIATKKDIIKKYNDFVKTERSIVNYVKISNELADFLNVEKGAVISTMDIHKAFNNYIHENGLSNGSKIKTSDEICRLLRIPPNYELDFFNLGFLLKTHHLPI